MIKFKAYDLIFGDDYPELSVFPDYMPKRKHFMPIGTKFYEFSWQIRDDRFFIISVDYDGQNYRDKVYDKNTEEENENPRQAHQLELKLQFFACYDNETETLYLSDSEKKATLVKYWREFFPAVDIRIRERFASIEEFERRLKFLKGVRFIQSRNLHNQSSQSVFSQRYDILGLEVPDKITAKIEYNNPLTRPFALSQLKELRRMKEIGEYDSISIVGEDADGVETVFDFETLISSIGVNVKQDENYRYDTDEVFDSLILELSTKNV